MLATLLLLALGAAAWVKVSFDDARFRRVAIEWMRANHARELAFDGPIRLQLWPQPAVTVEDVRLSEPGRPEQRFAALQEAALTLRLGPLLRRREVEVDRVTARGLQVAFRRDASGQNNADDLLARVTSGGGRASQPIVIDAVELADIELQVADAITGVHGRFTIGELNVGALGPGLRSPLHLRAQAELTEPALNAALELDAAFELLSATDSGASPIVQLSQTHLQLRGEGFEFEALQAQLRAEAIRLGYGAQPGMADSRVHLDAVQLQFSGRRLGWQIDTGRLDLARLQLDMGHRTLGFEQLAAQLQGRHGGTTLEAQLAWPELKVVGDSLLGGPMDGRLELAGDQRLQLKLRSQAPSGTFERITVPALHVEVDGQAGTSRVQGHAEATLALEPKPLAAALDALTLALHFTDPALPPLQLALKGTAQLSARSGSGRAEGLINDQSFEARLDAALERRPAFVDVDARFGTLDLTRFVAPAGRAAPTPTGDARPFNLQPLQWADLRLRLNVARLLWPPYRVDGLELQGGIDNGVLDLQRLAGRAWGGRVEASGSADAASGRLRLRLRANDVDIGGLLSDTLGYTNLSGRGRLDANLSSRAGTVAAARGALNGSAAIALRPAALRGFDLARSLRSWRTAPQGATTTVATDTDRQTDFSELNASFEIRDGVARSTDLDGRSDFLRVAGEGSIDLVRGRVDYLLRARVVNTASGRAGPEMLMLNDVTVPVELRGPFGNVEWQVRWPTVTAAVAARSVPNVVRGAAGVAGSAVRGAAGVVRRSGDSAATPSSAPR